MSSAAEFVEGGAQDPCDDACSICLESFCDDDPATVSESRYSGVLVSWNSDWKAFVFCCAHLSLCMRRPQCFADCSFWWSFGGFGVVLYWYLDWLLLWRVCSIGSDLLCDPPTFLAGLLQVTSCKHEYHLQCILEW